MTAMIPLDFFGEAGEVVLFSPANGFPPRTYQQFINHLTSRYRVLALRHRPLWPGSQLEDVQSWHDIARDTQTLLHQRNIRQIIGIGHSLGAVANLLAAVDDPDRFRALVMIEPVFLPPFVSSLRRLIPRRLMERHPMVKVALNRRFEWASREEAFDHFRRKEVFSRWSDEALRDYVNHGLRDQAPNGTVTLAYTREWEARIYSTVPHAWPAVAASQQPTLAVRGSQSDTISAAAWRKWQKIKPGTRFIQMAGAGHMIPMEQPAELANHIFEFLTGLGEQAPDPES